MADYKGQTRTPYTNAIGAQKQANGGKTVADQPVIIAFNQVQPEAQPAAEIETIADAVKEPSPGEQPKKRGRPFGKK